jgi:hypothetical protein
MHKVGAMKFTKEAVSVRKSLVLGLACSLAVALAAGCGGSGHVSSQDEVPVVVTMHDAPPTGVTVLSFTVQVTGIKLEGAGISNANVLSNPVTIQLQNLQAGNDILAQTSIKAGTYTDAIITFGSVSATVENESGSSETVGTTTCASASVCQIVPTISQMSTTISSSPFPLTLTAGTPVDLSIDFNVNSSIGSDLSVTPSVTLSASTTALADSNLADIGGVTGTVTSTGTNQFTVTDSATGNSLTLNTGTSTTFGGFSSCTASPEDATCLTKGQTVNVNFGVGDSSPTSLAASAVNLDSGITNGVQATVVAVDPVTQQFTVVVTGTSGTSNGVAVGDEETVTAGTGATFGVESNGATLPAGLDFNGTSNLLVGQTVELDASSVSGANLTADEIMLAPTQFTGTSGTVNGSNVTINGLNGLFTNSGTTAIVADTGTTTTFGGVTGVTGLTNGDEVTVGGLLFGTPTAPVIVAGVVNDQTDLDEEPAAIVARK